MATRVTVASLQAYVEKVLSWENNGRTPVAFRGQRASHWKALPMLLRDGVSAKDYEKDLVHDLVSMHPQEFERDSGMFDRLVRMQHSGLPTRLLDVTTNPLVALWFATEPSEATDGGSDGKVIAYWVPDYRNKHFDSDVVSCIANLANLTKAEKDKIILAVDDAVTNFNRRDAVKRLHYFIRQEKFDFLPKINPIDLFRPVYVRAKLANRRILAQSGAFVIFGLQAPSQPYERDMQTRWIYIPEDRKLEMRRGLERLGIHASTLFPEIDKAAEFIAKRYAEAPVHL